MRKIIYYTVILMFLALLPLETSANNYKNALNLFPKDLTSLTGLNVSSVKKSSLYSQIIDIYFFSKWNKSYKRNFNIDLTKNIDGVVIGINTKQIYLPNHPVNLMMTFVFPEMVTVKTGIGRIPLDGAMVFAGDFDKSSIYRHVKSRYSSSEKSFRGIEYLCENRKLPHSVAVIDGKYFVIAPQRWMKEVIDTYKNNQSNIKRNSSLYNRFRPLMNNNTYWLIHKVSQSTKNELSKSTEKSNFKTVNYVKITYDMYSEKLSVEKECENSYLLKQLRKNFENSILLMKFAVKNFAPESIKYTILEFIESADISRNGKKLMIKTSLSPSLAMKFLKVNPKSFKQN